MARSSYYAVREGHTIGVFKTWSECSESVSGYPDNDYKKCATEDEAWDFVNADGPSSSSRGTRSATRTSGRTRSSSPGHHPAPRAYPMPRERTPQVPSRRYNIYIDGAAPSNGRAGATAGWGVYYEDEKYEHLNRSERLEGDLQTNNRAELTAAIEALRGAPRDGKPILHTDSRYTMSIRDWLPGWERSGFRTSQGKPVANQDLVRQLDREIRIRGGQVEWKHVKGHSGIYGNEMADRLAVQGANKPARESSSSSSRSTGRSSS